MNVAKAVPPLLGDENGLYKIAVRGNSGTGKTTLADQLGHILNIPVVHMDELFWRPGWVKRTDEEMIEDLRSRLDDAKGRGWVIDGNYEATSGFIDEKVSDIVWLDPPFYKYFPRVFWRTILRLLGIGPTCAPGCRETFWECFFSKDSIILWVIQHHQKVRDQYRPRIAAEDVSLGGRWRRFGDLSEVAAWLESIKLFGKTKNN